ncbi:MAG: hypothetical protein JXR10_06205 [Cyclobacteriaceae bacterium]
MENSKKSSDPYSGVSERGKQANADEAKKYNLLSVEIGSKRANIDIEKEHLFGRFFQDRTEFFIIENPELYIANAPVTQLTLYFVDSVLSKKKFDLSADIGHELIKSYGGFKFKGLNAQTIETSKKDKIMLKTSEGTFVNEKLSRYQMKWDKDPLRIRYVVTKDSTTSSYQLIEELEAYKSLFRQAERQR